MTFPFRFACAAAVTSLTACAMHAPPVSPTPLGYDVVITGGRVVDGTGNPWFYGDVGIRGDRIAAIVSAGALATAPAALRINARGRVVAPGFIDIQAQSYDAHLSGDGRVISKSAQGVTTEILGEGGTPAPANSAMLAAVLPADSMTRRAMTGVTGARGFGAWLNAMERHGSSANVRSYLGAEVQGRTHPRAYGTFARVLGKYGSATGALPGRALRGPGYVP